MMPMYIVSGVMIPVASIPQPYQGWMLLNPIVHGLEAARLAFAPYYHAVPGLDLGYLHLFALVLVFLGLALHVRFADRMVMQ
jgi:capsular polysaccharide transport system permease protein